MLDYLFIGAHPDDCEIFAGGTILSLKARGARVGILDLTRGEGGTFGSVAERREEYTEAAKLLALDYRGVLDLPDGWLQNSPETRERVRDALRELRPEMIFTFPALCRHPDHEMTHQIVRQALFLAGIKDDGVGHHQVDGTAGGLKARHRPCALAEFVEFYPVQKPDFVVDVTAYYEQKKAVVKCFRTQVLTDENEEVSPDASTFIRSHAFWDHFHGRLLWFGSLIGVRYGEPFCTSQTLRVSDPLKHFQRLFR